MFKWPLIYLRNVVCPSVRPSVRRDVGAIVIIDEFYYTNNY